MARNSTGDVDTELGFIGRKQYDKIGLTYIRARFYEPAAGRFITKDPVRDGFNWYSYCGGNPINKKDPFGLMSVLPSLDGTYYYAVADTTFFIRVDVVVDYIPFGSVVTKSIDSLGLASS